MLNDIVTTVRLIQGTDVEVVPRAQGFEKLARRLYWHMTRLCPDDDCEWEDLTDRDREFYLLSVEGLFEDREAIIEALTLTNDNGNRIS